MKIKDSEGNYLPDFKKFNNILEYFGYLGSIVFLVACATALGRGNHVVYDENTKQATITYKDGSVSILNY